MGVQGKHAQQRRHLNWASEVRKGRAGHSSSEEIIIESIVNVKMGLNSKKIT